ALVVTDSACGEDGGDGPGSGTGSDGGADAAFPPVGDAGPQADAAPNVPAPAPPTVCPPPVSPVDVSVSTIVGSGDAASCSESKLEAALAMGGNVTFDCGPSATITLTTEKTISKTTVIDGGGKITLSGGGTHRIFKTQGAVDFTVQNLTLADALVNGP